LAAPFALLAFVLSFTFPFVLAFPELKSIATARLGFRGHITVLREEMRGQRLKSALVKGGGGLPKADVGFELGPSAEGGNKHVDAGEFRDVVTGSLEELVVASNVAAEITELVELRKGCSNCGLSGGDFVVRDRSKRGFEFFDEIERRQRTNTEPMFGVNGVQRDLSNAGEDRGVEIGLGALLHFKRVSFKRVGGDNG
jgi:hypothetical protein